MNKLQEADLKTRFLSRERQMRLAHIQQMIADHDQTALQTGIHREDFQKGLSEGIAQGFKQGFEEGLAKATGLEQHRLLLKLLEMKFSPLQKPTLAKIELLKGSVEVDRLFERALEASSLEELELS